MPHIDPIRDYIKALRSFDGNDRKTAALHLAHALGSENTNALIESSLGKLLAQDTLSNDAVLQILATEINKKG